MGVLQKLKEFREKQSRGMADKRQHQQFLKEYEEEARVERETKKLERDLPLVQKKADVEEARARIAKAKMTIRQPPSFRAVSDVHAEVFRDGRASRRTKNYRGREILVEQRQPPLALPGFGANLGVGQRTPEKKKQRYGAFGEPL